MSTAQPLDELDQLDIISNASYGEHGYPHAAWARLRRESPVHWFDQPGAQPPYWAVTKHADIIEVSRKPQQFIIAPRIAVLPDLPPLEPGAPPVARHLLNMDPPDHALFRKVVSPRFTPRAIRTHTERITAIAHQVLDGLAADGETREVDFVGEIAAPFALFVLAELLGVPRDDWEMLFHRTNETIGNADPEYQQEGEKPEDTAERSRMALFGYFNELAERRRDDPRDDWVSAVLAGRPGGEPMGQLELLSYFFLLVVAGNETTRNALSGGIATLATHPDQWDALRADPGLTERAIEEIVRWTSPVIQFTRTAVEDYVLRGVTIRAGESVCLFYPSANRDDEVFDEPDRFRIDRDPNPHLGFGVGEHFCLGANLARLELRVMIGALTERLEHFELTGEPDRLQSSFVGGIKRLPVRLRLGAVPA